MLQYRLANDPQWKLIIDLCKENNSYIDSGSGEAFVVSEAKEAAQLAEKAREEALVREQQLKKELAAQEKKEREKQAAVATAPLAPVVASPPPSRAISESPPAPVSLLSPLAVPFSPVQRHFALTIASPNRYGISYFFPSSLSVCL